PDHKEQRKARDDQISHIRHPERRVAEHQIPHRTAADRRHETHDIGPEPTEAFGRRETDAADGKSEGTDVLNNRNKIHNRKINYRADGPVTGFSRQGAPARGIAGCATVPPASFISPGPFFPRFPCRTFIRHTLLWKSTDRICPPIPFSAQK